MIKYETTQMAVKDLEKYYTALDKVRRQNLLSTQHYFGYSQTVLFFGSVSQALLRFHSIKIGEINNIIRDLWNLTYKGEDITSIV